MHQTVRNSVIMLAFLGLVAFNVLTLVSAKIHDASYNALKGILYSAVGEATFSSLLRSSPTVVRRRETEIATNALLQEKSILLASNKLLLLKNNVLEVSLKDSSTRNTELARTSEIRAASVQKFSKQLASRTLVNATRNLSSIPAEAVPIVGVGVVLAVTAWDIYDACMTLKELNQLNTVFGHQQEDSTKVCGMKPPSMKEVMDRLKSNPLNNEVALIPPPAFK